MFKSIDGMTLAILGAACAAIFAGEAVGPLITELVDDDDDDDGQARG